MAGHAGGHGDVRRLKERSGQSSEEDLWRVHSQHHADVHRLTQWLPDQGCHNHYHHHHHHYVLVTVTLDLMDTIRQRKLQLFGHICRMSYDRLLKSLVFGMVEGERRPGRPVRRWIDDILMWCGQDGQEAMMMTVDRDNWWRFVASPYGRCWPREWRRRRRHDQCEAWLSEPVSTMGSVATGFNVLVHNKSFCVGKSDSWDGWGWWWWWWCLYCRQEW